MNAVKYAFPATSMNASRIILIAGVARSGSTWLFNAVRRILEESGMEVHAAWISEWRCENPSAFHLVKVHSPNDVNFVPDLVFSTRRPTEDCLASLVRMGWLRMEPDAIRANWNSHEHLQAYWHERSTLEIDYDRILSQPHEALEKIAAALRIPLTASTCRSIACELSNMKAPVSGEYDPTTLLHPGHRRQSDREGPTPEEILRIVNRP